MSVDKVFLCGYTPYPLAKDDNRLPHLALKISKQIEKTALGAEKTVAWKHVEDIEKLINNLQESGYEIVSLEQAPRSIDIREYWPADKVAIIVGREVEGIEPEILAMSDRIVEIPMMGSKESFNVAQASAMLLFYCRFAPLDIKK